MRITNDVISTTIIISKVLTEINSTSKVPTFVFMCAQFTFQADHFENDGGAAGDGDAGTAPIVEDTAAAAAVAGRFVPAKFTMAPEYVVLRTHAGLATKEQQRRLALLGPNDIPYKLNTWTELVVAEFSSYLYLYQFTFFLVWLWFGGLIWCSPQIVSY